jgi:hypothetical protein
MVQKLVRGLVRKLVRRLVQRLVQELAQKTKGQQNDKTRHCILIMLLFSCNMTPTEAQQGQLQHTAQLSYA